MKKSKVKRIGSELQRRVEALIASGGFMNDGGDVNLSISTGEFWHDEVAGTCLLGATIFGVPEDIGRWESYHAKAARLLGLSIDEVRSLEYGYAGWVNTEPFETDRDLVSLGRSFRKRYYGGDEPPRDKHSDER